MSKTKKSKEELEIAKLNKKERKMKRRLAIECFDKGAVYDSELMKILLDEVDPYGDNHETIANDLWYMFGSAYDTFCALPRETMRVKNVTRKMAEFLMTIGYCKKTVEIQRVQILSSQEEINQFVKVRLMSREDEFLELYLLDKRNRIIKILSYTSGEKGRASVSMAEVSKEIAVTNAKKVYMAHNHLYYSTEPSQADMLCTEQMQLICCIHDVDLCDHIIYAQGSFFSFAQENILSKIKLKVECKL